MQIKVTERERNRDIWDSKKMNRPWRFCYREVAPFSALVTVQFTEVGVNILFKEATRKGLSYYAFIFYSFALSNLVLLLPLPFIFRRFCLSYPHLIITCIWFKSISFCTQNLSFNYYCIYVCICRSTGLPSLNFSLLCKVFSLGLLT